MGYMLIVTLQMILSAILGFIHGGVLGYFVAGLNILGIMMEILGLGYAIGTDKNTKEKSKNEL